MKNINLVIAFACIIFEQQIYPNEFTHFFNTSSQNLLSNTIANLTKESYVTPDMQWAVLSLNNPQNMIINATNGAVQNIPSIDELISKISKELSPYLNNTQLDPYKRALYAMLEATEIASTLVAIKSAYQDPDFVNRQDLRDALQTQKDSIQNILKKANAINQSYSSWIFGVSGPAKAPKLGVIDPQKIYFFGLNSTTITIPASLMPSIIQLQDYKEHLDATTAANLLFKQCFIAQQAHQSNPIAINQENPLIAQNYVYQNFPNIYTKHLNKYPICEGILNLHPSLRRARLLHVRQAIQIALFVANKKSNFNIGSQYLTSFFDGVVSELMKYDAYVATLCKNPEYGATNADIAQGTEWSTMSKVLAAGGVIAVAVGTAAVYNYGGEKSLQYVKDQASAVQNWFTGTSNQATSNFNDDFKEPQYKTIPQNPEREVVDYGRLFDNQALQEDPNNIINFTDDFKDPQYKTIPQNPEREVVDYGRLFDNQPIVSTPIVDDAVNNTQAPAVKNPKINTPGQAPIPKDDIQPQLDFKAAQQAHLADKAKVEADRLAKEAQAQVSRTEQAPTIQENKLGKDTANLLNKLNSNNPPASSDQQKIEEPYVFGPKLTPEQQKAVEIEEARIYQEIENGKVLAKKEQQEREDKLAADKKVSSFGPLTKKDSESLAAGSNNATSQPVQLANNSTVVTPPVPSQVIAPVKEDKAIAIAPIIPATNATLPVAAPTPPPAVVDTKKNNKLRTPLKGKNATTPAAGQETNKSTENQNDAGPSFGPLTEKDTYGIELENFNKTHTDKTIHKAAQEKEDALNKELIALSKLTEEQKIAAEQALEKQRQAQILENQLKDNKADLIKIQNQKVKAEEDARKNNTLGSKGYFWDTKNPIIENLKNEEAKITQSNTELETKAEEIRKQANQAVQTAQGIGEKAQKLAETIEPLKIEAQTLHGLVYFEDKKTNAIVKNIHQTAHGQDQDIRKTIDEKKNLPSEQRIALENEKKGQAQQAKNQLVDNFTTEQQIQNNAQERQANEANELNKPYPDNLNQNQLSAAQINLERQLAAQGDAIDKEKKDVWFKSYVVNKTPEQTAAQNARNARLAQQNNPAQATPPAANQKPSGTPKPSESAAAPKPSTSGSPTAAQIARRNQLETEADLIDTENNSFTGGLKAIKNGFTIVDKTPEQIAAQKERDTEDPEQKKLTPTSVSWIRQKLGINNQAPTDTPTQNNTNLADTTPIDSKSSAVSNPTKPGSPAETKPATPAQPGSATVSNTPQAALDKAKKPTLPLQAGLAFANQNNEMFGDIQEYLQTKQDEEKKAQAKIKEYDSSSKQLNYLKEKEEEAKQAETDFNKYNNDMPTVEANNKIGKQLDTNLKTYQKALDEITNQRESNSSFWQRYNPSGVSVEDESIETLNKKISEVKTKQEEFRNKVNPNMTTFDNAYQFNKSRLDNTKANQEILKKDLEDKRDTVKVIKMYENEKAEALVTRETKAEDLVSNAQAQVAPSMLDRAQSTIKELKFTGKNLGIYNQPPDEYSAGINEGIQQLQTKQEQQRRDEERNTLVASAKSRKYSNPTPKEQVALAEQAELDKQTTAAVRPTGQPAPVENNNSAKPRTIPNWQAGGDAENYGGNDLSDDEVNGLATLVGAGGIAKTGMSAVAALTGSKSVGNLAGQSAANGIASFGKSGTSVASKNISTATSAPIQATNIAQTGALTPAPALAQNTPNIVAAKTAATEGIKQTTKNVTQQAPTASDLAQQRMADQYKYLFENLQ